MGSSLEPGLQLILLLCLAVTAGIAFGAITMMIQLRRWNAAVLSMAVTVGFLLIGGVGIFSRTNPTYHNSMVFAAFLAFFIFVPIAAIGSYVGLKVFLQNHYPDLSTDNNEESAQVVITQSPTPADNRALQTIVLGRPQSPLDASAERAVQSDRAQSRGEGDGNHQQETRISFRRSRQL